MELEVIPPPPFRVCSHFQLLAKKNIIMDRQKRLCKWESYKIHALVDLVDLIASHTERLDSPVNVILVIHDWSSGCPTNEQILKYGLVVESKFFDGEIRTIASGLLD